MSDLKSVKAAERAAAREARAAERAAKRTTAKADRESKTRKGDLPRELQVAITSFDFLDGAYKATRSARLVNYVILGVVAAVLMVILGSGLNSILAVKSEESALASSQSTLQAAQAELGASGGGISVAQATNQIVTRGKQIDTALATEVDALQILNDLSAAAPSGVVIERIALPGGEAPSAPSSESGSESSEGSEGSESGPKELVLTVSATATTYSQADAWDQAVSRIGYLQGVSTDVGGSEGAITVTTTAKVGPEVTGTRAAQLKSQLGLGTAATPSGGNK